MHPENLWRDDFISAQDVRWWCLHTKPRQEKATARHLLERKIAYYLPQVSWESRTPAGRKIRSIIPMFPSYVFMLADDVQRLEAFRRGTLVKVLEVVDQTCLVRDLRQMDRMIASGLPVIPEPTHPVGVRVRITSGPLTGLIGTVIRRGNRDRFVAVVTFLGSGAVVDLEDWQVESLGAPPD